MNRTQLSLLGGFECIRGGTEVTLPLGAQRLLALLALRGRMHRTTAGEWLWPDSTRRRAASNLRSALWRARQVGGATVIDQIGPRLQLGELVGVDVHVVDARVHEALGSPVPGEQCASVAESLGRELLPDWADDWLVFERERWDQLRLHALEAVVEKLRDAEQYPAALQTALATIAIEPIRETAHRLVIELHLAEGNSASALRHYQRYRGLLERELGIGPSGQMDQLVRPLMTR